MEIVSEKKNIEKIMKHFEKEAELKNYLSKIEWKELRAFVHWQKLHIVTI